MYACLVAVARDKVHLTLHRVPVSVGRPPAGSRTSSGHVVDDLGIVVPHRDVDIIPVGILINQEVTHLNRVCLRACICIRICLPIFCHKRDRVIRRIRLKQD